MVAAEERVQVFLIQKLHIFIEIALNTADTRNITAELIAAHIQLIQLGRQDIPLKIHIAPDKRGGDLADQQLPFNNIDVQGQVLNPRLLRIDLDFPDTSVLDIQGIVQILIHIEGFDQPLRDFLLGIGQDHIGAAFNMGIQHGLEIKIGGQVSLGHNHVFFLLILQKVQNACQRLHTSVVDLHRFFRKGGDDVQPAVFTGQIPFTPGTKMVHKRMVILADNHGNVVNSGIDHAGQHKINHPVTPCKGNGGHQTLRNQFRYQGIIAVGKNDAECICIGVYHSTSPSFTL